MVIKPVNASERSSGCGLYLPDRSPLERVCTCAILTRPSMLELLLPHARLIEPKTAGKSWMKRWTKKLTRDAPALIDQIFAALSDQTITGPVPPRGVDHSQGALHVKELKAQCTLAATIVEDGRCVPSCSGLDCNARSRDQDHREYPAHRRRLQILPPHRLCDRLC